MSNGLRWSKFFWQDWQKDKALQGCSLAARGLWMEILCVAHDADPYGHLVLNGKAPTAKQLGSIFGNTSEREVTKLLVELEAAGIFSREPDGTIFCRRMMRDKDTTETFRAYGKTGGNPALNGRVYPPKKHEGGLTPPLTLTLNPHDNPPHKPGLNGGVKLELDTESEVEAEKESKKDLDSSSLSSPCCTREREPEAVSAVEEPSDGFVTAVEDRVDPTYVETTIAKLGRSLKHVSYAPGRSGLSREEQIEALTPSRPTPHYLNHGLLSSMPHRQRALAAVGRR